MLEKHKQKCQELRQTVKHMSDNQEMLSGDAGKEKILGGEESDEFRKQIFQEVTKLKERFSEGELELLQKKQSLERICRDIM